MNTHSNRIFPILLTRQQQLDMFLKKRVGAKLILLNAIGEEIAVLVNEEQDFTKLILMQRIFQAEFISMN
ncbi:MAG: hypothetical protein MZV64_46050 [Ignavibacteriales bacterium]|nr:hypothetical protein [Ignavibacteriales bacterium]